MIDVGKQSTWASTLMLAIACATGCTSGQTGSADCAESAESAEQCACGEGNDYASFRANVLRIDDVTIAVEIEEALTNVKSLGDPEVGDDVTGGYTMGFLRCGGSNAERAVIGFTVLLLKPKAFDSIRDRDVLQIISWEDSLEVTPNLRVPEADVRDFVNGDFERCMYVQSPCNDEGSCSVRPHAGSTGYGGVLVLVGLGALLRRRCRWRPNGNPRQRWRRG
jgi:MYXO-CTERM domain-containing protein